MIHPIILCGGSGTRMWPSSRQSLPKQFVRLVGDHSLFQQACRLATVAGQAPPLVVTGEDVRFIVKEQLEALALAPAAILIEPEARSTAPAVLLAALHLVARDPQAMMLVLPADQLIRDPDAFHAAVAAATDAARAGMLVTFGIAPTNPDTGFGYLELADAGARTASTPQPLRRFVEKPDAATAADMLGTGRYLWNAGIFLFSAAAIVQAFHDHAPDILAAVSQAITEQEHDLGFTRFSRSHWSRSPGISLDYAIMEKAANLVVMPCEAAWTDLGDWNRVWAELDRNEDGNALSGPVTSVDCVGSLLRSEAPGLHVVGLDLADMLVIATADAVLVAPRSASPRVGEVVARLKQAGVPQAVSGARELRPWGWYERLTSGAGFQVKRILVKPGASLSLQSHAHRAEHWVVVAGTATVQLGDEDHILSPNHAAYIPIGARHRLSNRGCEPVVLIEVQTGGYLGEDDIVRYEDQYSRAGRP